MEPEPITPTGNATLAPLRAAFPLGVPVPCRVARLVQGRRYAFLRLADGSHAFMPGTALHGLRFTELRPDQEVDCWLEIGCAGLQAVRVQRRRKRRKTQQLSGKGGQADA